MANIRLQVSTLTVTLSAPDAAAAKLIQIYCRVYNAPAELTDPQKLDWFLRHLVQRAKADVDELEIAEAGRDAAIVAREERIEDVFA